MIKLIKSTFYKESSTKKKLRAFIAGADQLSFGPQCELFEKKFARWQKRKHCVFVNSGSSANLAIIQALLNLGKIKHGDKVGFSALTWSTNAMPIIQLGLTAIPIDVELDTLNVSSSKLQAVLKKHSLKLLFITNLLGFCDDIDAVAAICKENNILLIEDNCESLGTVYKGKRLGNYGLASTFSFYVGHHMSTIEGGAVVTDNEQLATMLALVRAHGWDRNLSAKRQAKIRNKYKMNSTFYSRYTFYDLGYNMRPTEINGFIGNSQLPYLDEIIAKRKSTFLRLVSCLNDRPDICYPLKYKHIDLLSNFAMPIVCKSKAIRDKLVKKCNGVVEIRPIVGGDITQQPFFTKHMRKYSFTNPNAKLVHDQGLYFGNNPELTHSEIDLLIKTFFA
jgi:CDP-4-dehydro-6-deoxyglucose reductase, E1